MVENMFFLDSKYLGMVGMIMVLYDNWHLKETKVTN